MYLHSNMWATIRVICLYLCVFEDLERLSSLVQGFEDRTIEFGVKWDYVGCSLREICT